MTKSFYFVEKDFLDSSKNLNFAQPNFKKNESAEIIFEKRDIPKFWKRNLRHQKIIVSRRL